MLVGADDGRVDEHPPVLAEVGVGGHPVEQGLQPARPDPPPEPVVHGVPPAELGGEVPPRDAGPGEVQQGLEEVPVGELRLRPLAVPLGLVDHRSEGVPEVVREHVPHGIRP